MKVLLILLSVSLSLTSIGMSIYYRVQAYRREGKNNGK